MQSHRRHRRHVRRLALGLAACTALAVAAPAGAEPGADYPAASQTRIGDTPADFSKPVGAAPKVGDTPADFSVPATVAPKGGDTPVDFPGASGAPDYQSPTTFEVVRPERTIVRDVDEALPVILSGLALLIAMGGVGFVVLRGGRRPAGRTQ